MIAESIAIYHVKFDSQKKKIYISCQILMDNDNNQALFPTFGPSYKFSTN